jgi:hypothetical protein
MDALGKLLPYDRMSDEAWKAELLEQYKVAKPYPHLVFDNFFDPEVLDKVIAEFPDPEDLGVKFNNAREIKRATSSEAEIPPFSRAFIHGLNSGTFLSFLEDVTGIDGLVADPHLVGGGFHALPRGGKLAIHTDFNYHKRLRLDRRINVLVYLNKDWPEEYGGQFEAWMPNGQKPEASYLPLFNRMVIFGTNDYTFHGNPVPVACPESRSRRSIAMYYYTNGRPESEWTGLIQTTRFMNRPGEQIVEKEPMWMAAMRHMPKFARVWFTKNLYERRLAQKRAEVG